MTTLATQININRQLDELDQSELRAWGSYMETLQGLNSEAYEEVEVEAWDVLQNSLREIAQRRAELEHDYQSAGKR